ncbi:MAG: hypothetical protein NZ900_01420 [Synergistetes bacterium]|nr:hypothetical protein [Synergistota bacterium]MDW8191586.1 hypothetical protein [Synergistota bacterium]
MKKILLLLLFIEVLTLLALLTSVCFSIEKESLLNFAYKTSYLEEPVKLKNGKGVIIAKDGKTLDISFENFIFIHSAKKELKAIAVILSAKADREDPSYDIMVLIPEKEGLTQLKPYSLGKVKIKDWQGKWQVSTMPFNERWIITLDIKLPNGEEETLSLSQKGDSIVPADETVIRKPALYLYPTRKEKIKVRLSIDGEITESDPPYNNHWEVEATPEGNLSTGHRYLFYEAKLNSPLKLSKGGWLVKREQLSSWLDETLPRLGLKGREISDFKEYWLKELPESRYYVIRTISKESISEKLKLNIDPPPATIIRVFLHIEPTNEPVNIEPEKLLDEPKRIGFTAVEWGVVIKGEVEIKEKPKISSNQYETGLMLLKGIKLDGPQLTIRVDSGGCTTKETIETKIRKGKPIIKGHNHYSISFIRKVPDKCKAFFPEGIDIAYDLIKELKLNPPFTISIENPVSPVITEKYFSIKPGKSESKEVNPETSLKIDLIQATIRAIESEIKRYMSRVPPEPEKAKELERELERFKSMRPEDYPLEGAQHDPFKRPGVIMPPLIEEVEIVSLPKLGELLKLTKQSKSGPFFHVAGIAKDVSLLAKPDITPPFKAKIYLIFKREYFANIPNYYVYVERISRE